MMSAVANVHAEPPKTHLPREINVPLNEQVSAACPTHMLAVYSHSPAPNAAPNPTSNAPAQQRREVTTYPVHSLVLSAHCSNLPALPPRSTARVPENTINLPVVLLGLPSAETFPVLQSYLYTKRVDNLLSAFMPLAPEPVRTGTPLTQIIANHSEVLGEMFDAETLLRHAMLINGVWRNACVLGIRDDTLWGSIELAWGSLIGGLEIAALRNSR